MVIISSDNSNRGRDIRLSVVITSKSRHEINYSTIVFFVRYSNALNQTSREMCTVLLKKNATYKRLCSVMQDVHGQLTRIPDFRA